MLLLHWNEQRFAEESAAVRSLRTEPDHIVIATDFSQLDLTLSTIVEARRRGQTVALYPLLADPLEGLIEQVGTAIAQHRDAGQRFVQLLALRDHRLNVNQKPLHEAAQYEPHVLRGAVLCVKLCDVLLCFTSAERDRWSALIGRPIRRFAYLPTPKVHRRAPDAGGLAVYAPDMTDAQLALVALSLQERRVTAQFVRSAGSDIPAGTVIVPHWWRPARVLSLAAAGYAVVTPERARPDERCICATYQPTDAFSFGAAVDAAQSLPGALRFDIEAHAVEAAIQNAGAHAIDGPRVSVIVRTFDRPVLLARALRSIVAQTYRNLEVVVVNNGGPNVRHIVAQACRDSSIPLRRTAAALAYQRGVQRGCASCRRHVRRLFGRR